MVDPKRLRQLAAWYREFAEKTDNTVIWDARLRTAEGLEEEAVRVEAHGLSEVASGSGNPILSRPFD